MRGPVLIDSNVLVLLVVGGTSRSYVEVHKNTKSHFDTYDFDLLTVLVKDFSEIVLVAHVVAETSNLIRQIGEPRRTAIQRVFFDFVAQTHEMPIASVDGLDREESIDLGVTDAILLELCGRPLGDEVPTPLTIDSALADRGHALGYSVIDFKRDINPA